MKSKNRTMKWGWLPLLCLTLSGCAGTDLLDEIPRDISAVPTEKSISVQTETELKTSDSASLEGTAEKDRDSFLWEGADDYAYSCLSEPEQIWYHDIEKILGSHEETQQLSETGLDQGLDETDIDRIFQCVLNDHPELFYVEGYSYTKFTKNDTISSVEFSGTYNADTETARAKNEQIQSAVEKILSGISESASDYDKVKYVYDTLIRDTDYQLDAVDNQNIFSVFVNHASVCQGYAKATQYLLNRLGIECTLVLGTVETGEGHAWNLVKVNGSYYYVDTTWGDASYQMEEQTNVQQIPAMPEINYDYLNVTTEELLRTHTIGGCVPMPACVATEENYYVKEGALFDHYNTDQMSTLFSEAFVQGREDVTVKCSTVDCYQEILHALIEEQDIFKYLGNAGNSIAYAQNDKQLSLTFWVTNE